MTPNNTPFYFRFTMILLMLALLCALVYLAQDIIIPLCFAMLLSILVLPLVNYLEKRTGRIFAILVVLFLSTIVIAALLYFLSAQVASFMDDLPTIKKQLNVHLHTVQNWVRQQFNMSVKEQDKMMTDAASQIKGSGSGYLGQTFFSITKSLMTLILLPVYSFLLLYYRDMLRKFIIDVFGKDNTEKVKDVLKETKTIVNSYMVGLMIEMAIVATINTVGFLIIGVQYAIFLGVLAAILNLIPYIGMLIATVFCMLITLTTSNQLGDVVWVAVILVAVQFIDNNIIMPRVVSSKVKVNALISIIGVLIGGTLAGISGMFLSIPAIALLKTIFERIDELKPWGMLLGDDITGKKKAVSPRKTKK